MVQQPSYPQMSCSEARLFARTMLESSDTLASRSARFQTGIIQTGCRDAVRRSGSVESHLQLCRHGSAVVEEPRLCPLVRGQVNDLDIRDIELATSLVEPE